MPEIDALVMQVFRDEVLKTAGVNTRLGAGATLGLLGAAGGAGIGYLRNRLSNEPQEGSPLGSAARGALLGGLGGAGMGAVLPSSARAAVSRFGMRELHGVTGYTPKGESLRSMHAGAFPAQAAEVQAARGLERVRQGVVPEQGLLDRAHAALFGAPDHLADAEKTLARAQKGRQAAEAAQDWGMTSLPGIAKSVKKNGLLPTIARGARAQFSGTGHTNKALMVGLPALGLVQAARAPELQGAGRGEALGHQGGQLVGGLAGGLLPFGAGMVLQEGTGRAGRAAGRAFDAVRGKLRKAPSPESLGPHPAMSSDLTQAGGQAVPSEVVMSSRAMGLPPEGYG